MLGVAVVVVEASVLVVSVLETLASEYAVAELVATASAVFVAVAVAVVVAAAFAAVVALVSFVG